MHTSTVLIDDSLFMLRLRIYFFAWGIRPIDKPGIKVLKYMISAHWSKSWAHAKTPKPITRPFLSMGRLAYSRCGNLGPRNRGLAAYTLANMPILSDPCSAAMRP